MRKLLIFLTVFICSLQTLAFGEHIDKYAGRWAEKTSERVVMDIYKDIDEYKIFITWREDTLAQKDIYRFRAKVDSNGTLNYKNGIHIYRFFDNESKFSDIIDYEDGQGSIKIIDNKLIWIDNKDNSKTEFIRADKDLIKDTTIKTKLFSFILPEELKNIYEVKKEKDKISVFHKESKSKGFGGFAFGIKAYKNPAEHAMLPGSCKLGELTDKRGELYDIVLKYPTDVQYDYTKGVTPPDTFKLLYDVGEYVDIKGLNGSKYFKNQGMKGENLYTDVLAKHIQAVNEKWDSNKLEKENMSYMYNVLKNSGDSVLDKIGYTYYDVNADGIEELLIGEIADGSLKGVVYDIYTMVNRKPQHVISGGERNRYYVCDDSFICNEYSSGALESGMRVYNLVENSTELFPQVSFKYDGYLNSKEPYFLSYTYEKWENVTKEIFEERKKVFNTYERFDFRPLSGVNVIKKLSDKYNFQKDYFDYSVVLSEFPSDYFYTTVKINKSKERILIITDKVTENKNSNHGLFYYIAKNGFVYPLGYMESVVPFSQSMDYIYLNNGKKTIKFYISDKDFKIVKSLVSNKKRYKRNDGIVFEPINSAERFAGEYGSPAGDDIKKITVDGFYFEYHKPQYKRKYIKTLMRECINDGVKTQVQMYCCMVKKIHL